ncbi:arrestin domain-containing protein 17-like isoform X2 [Vespula squamosa]|uniref:Arrestin domain-containing protein 17-like isoform X2 n=1 Tax=Vespula squamosa TaxID=30214 RepID=A0ABD2BMJ7_VESSQ
MHFKGKANVQWTITGTGQDINGSDHYITTEKENDEVEFPDGLSFSFLLPKSIPCSFQHKIGYIRYITKAMVDIPWKLNWKTKSTFIVATAFDLNTEIICQAKDYTTKERILIQKDQVEVPIRTHHQAKLKLHVPSLPPSNLQNCGIIELKYSVRVNIRVSGTYKKIDRKYPILIGTIPHFFPSPWTQWSQADNIQSIASIIYQVPSVSTVIEPTAIPILKFVKNIPEKIINLPGISSSNFNESQLTKNQPIRWNMREERT